ncbi:MAG: enoyl-CoA hydratase/isomerase family protein [Bosea sp.]|uniref:enoyl-CoA hydratase/isomerase family protein n=1 Tax=Bosea sp. (in: a-proteobacteria) TaxID=1871050 RepID=UPI001AD35191|nr:enoyl-CoA hydratase-related protein [Bosea sp. (in: a-proteobacteria)]MBN9450459.1 enoyl-CoA hydratase/isomerase family protein [Bosea sp. (in: a-proteobacteria)]
MSDASDSVQLTRDGGVAILTLNRPAVLNAIDAPMAERFLAQIKAIAASRDVRAILLQGNGRAFCAGGDVSQFLSGSDIAAGIEAIMAPLHAALRLLDALPQPSVACLQGAVAGGGFSLALACDLAIAADDARFTMAYARIGATPDLGGTYRLARLGGQRRAREIALLAETFGAGEALNLGLVNRVVPVAEARDAALATARKLAAGPTGAFGRIRTLLAQAPDADLATHLDAERDAFRATTVSADFREGVTAFLEKRPAVFTGL